MGAQGAVNILYRNEIKKVMSEGGDVETARQSFVTEYEDTLANPYIAAERGYVDAVIQPRAPASTWCGRCGPCGTSASRRCPRSTATSRCERGPECLRTRGAGLRCTWSGEMRRPRRSRRCSP